MKYVYCVLSHVDTEPRDNVRRNGLMGVYSSKKRADEHLHSILAERRKNPDFKQWDMHTVSASEMERHKDVSFREYYCLEMIEYVFEYIQVNIKHVERLKVEKRIVIGNK